MLPLINSLSLQALILSVQFSVAYPLKNIFIPKLKDLFKPTSPLIIISFPLKNNVEVEG